MTFTADNSKQTPRRCRWRMPVVSVLLALLGAVAVMVLLRDERKPVAQPSDDALAVPLGVEEAAIIQFGGPRLVARPYRRGASVNLRIARQAERDGVGIYDVRYIVNLPGRFDLTEYLTSADGGSIERLPSFHVRGETRLTKDIETRIREIEDVEIRIWHGYSETLTGLGILWLSWLLGLIFIGRPKRAPCYQPPPPEPSIEQRINGYLAQLADGELAVDDKAKLEVLLLTYWKTHLKPERRLAETCRQLQRHERFGDAYTTLQSWLHCPSADVDINKVRSLCTPLAAGCEGGSR